MLNEFSTFIPAKMHSEEWHALRSKGIGASDSAAALGLSKWKTPFELWEEKRGIISPTEETWPQRRGKALEPELKWFYETTTGNTVTAPQGIFKSQEYPWMIMSPDGLIPEGKILAEFKTATTSDGWGEEGTDEVPQEYLIQVQHMLIILKYEVAEISVSIAGREPKLYVVRPDKELQGMIIEEERMFWEKVLTGQEPAPISDSDVRRKYKRSLGTEIVSTTDMAMHVSRIKALKEVVKGAEKEMEPLKIAVMTFMANNEVLMEGDKPIATWKETKEVKKFDVELFKSHHPELYESYIKMGEPQRRFLLK